MRVNAITLPRTQRRVLYAILALLFVSGAVWAWLQYLASPVDEVVGQWKTWSLQLHGAAAMAALVVIGMLLGTHVKSAWRANRNPLNGVLLLTVLGILTVTGYALYYAGNELLRTWSSWIHLGIGLLLPIALLIHIVVGRKSRG